MSPRTLSDIRTAETMTRRFWTFDPTQAYLFVKGVGSKVGSRGDLVHQHKAVFDAALDTLCLLFTASLDRHLDDLFGGAR